MENKRVQTILISIITTLFISALLFTEIVTSADAGNQTADPAITAGTNQLHSANSANAADSFTINIGIYPVYSSGQIRIEPSGLSYGNDEAAPISENVSLYPEVDSGYWQFTNWSGTYLSTTVPLPLSATQNYSVTANFVRRCFDLTLGFSGGGDLGENPVVTSSSVYCDPGQYAADETIILEAANLESEGWQITGWSGAVPKIGDPYEANALMPPNDHSVLVHYEPICYNLNVSFDADEGMVTQIPEPNCPIETPGNKYHKGTNVSLSASAKLGYEFQEWSGDTVGDVNEPTMLIGEMTQNRSITANFNAACHTLTRAHSPTNLESGGDPVATPDRSSPECTGLNEYVFGEKINLLASPNTDWQVEGWINTNNDSSTGVSNILTFPKLPAETIDYIVTVKYIENPTLQFRDNGYRVVESIGEVAVYVERIGSDVETVSVDYATEDGSAKSTPGPNQDYVEQNGTLTFKPGEREQSFKIRIKNDNLKEGGDENFLLKLSNPEDALLGLPKEIEITIEDDEQEPTVNFSAIEYESLESSSPATITVTLYPASSSDVFVTYDALDGGTATYGQDYAFLNEEVKILHFEPFMTSKPINIAVEPDTLDETDETVQLALIDILPVGVAERGVSEALLTIIDDDSSPNVYFDETNYYAKEGNATAPVTVTLSAASAISVAVDYEVIELAVGRQLVGTITFEPGEESKKVDIPIGGYQAGDQLEIVLDKAVNATLVTPSSATLKILDYDLSDCHQLLIEKSGHGSLPVTEIDHSEGCPEGHFIESTINISAEPDPGWTINGWQGTINDSDISSENVVKMPDSDHTVTIYYITYSYLSTAMHNYVSYFKGPEEIEPNNGLSVLQANGPIQSGIQYRGGFPSASDQFDVYYLYLADKGNIQIELTNIPLNRDYNLYLYSAGAELMGYSGSLDNNDELISSSSLDRGVYYIAVDFADSPPSSGKYRITATYN